MIYIGIHLIKLLIYNMQNIRFIDFHIFAEAIQIITNFEDKQMYRKYWKVFARLSKD
jgi:hypothetical protein